MLDEEVEFRQINITTKKLLHLKLTMAFAYGDAIAIIGGTYRGKTGTFLRYAGLTRKSCCVRINGDSQNERTIRLKSIATDTDRSTTRKAATIEVDAEEYNALVKEVTTMVENMHLLREKLINVKKS